METLLTASNITFVLGIMVIIFTIYNYFKNPQIKLERDVAVSEKEVLGKASALAQQVENKATILAQQLQWEKENNAVRFSELQVNIKEVMTLAQNHIHTVDIKVDKLQGIMEHMGNEITRLATIIDERIPKKII